MDNLDPSPAEIAELFALDKDIAVLCGRLLSELNGGSDRAEVASVVLANSRKSEGQGLLHALVQQHMSLVLRACARHEQADAWHAAGVASGGSTCEDPPGVREGASGQLYLAYLRDPDGHKLCALYRVPRA